MTRALDRSTVSLVAAVSIAGLLGGCGGDTGTGTGTGTTTASEISQQAQATTAASTTPPTSAAADAPSTSSTPATEPETTDRAARYPEIATTEAAPGSNPLLSWTPVDGAALYRIVVLDPGGDPYWAWSGTDTSVALGGNETPTAVGARVFGEMTWQVAAHDADGIPLAMSARARLSP